jgi:hypothetical protein
MGVPLERSSGLFGLSDRFEAEFPTIQDAIIRFTESDFGNSPKTGVWSLRNNGPVMSCGNPSCQRGGYNLANEVHNMIYAGMSEREIRLSCNGDEGSPKGRRLGRECLQRLEAKITLKFKASHNGQHSNK